MIKEFYSFPVVLSGVGKILLLIGFGFALSAFKIIKKGMLNGLSAFLLWICLPSLFFVKLTSFFDAAEFPTWWVLPIGAVVMGFAGLGVGYLAQLPLKECGARREFMASCAFQNCGYLPLAFIAFTTTGALREELLIYIFLFLLGFNLNLWFFVPAFLAREEASLRTTREAILNPPMISMAIALISVSILGKGWLPHVVAAPLKIVGNTSFPLSLILLGLSLEIHKGYRLRSWSELGMCLFVKLLLFPFLALPILFLIPLHETDRFILLLETTMPVAVTLILIGHYKNANNAFLSASIFYSHLFAILTVPLWLFVFSFMF
ncbi:MAG: AEC family transporter [Candidatus Omnitrophica bacterium]|nr:AEC family transporter [Candidatus Omnitrophota bacterium]